MMRSEFRRDSAGNMTVILMLVMIGWLCNPVQMRAQGLNAEEPDSTHRSAFQDGDYSEYPQIDADYHHLELVLEWLQGNQLDGSARYTLRLMRPGVREIRLQANRMDISTVQWNGASVDWNVSGEELVIRLPEGAEADRDHRLRIDYVADPLFGMHRSAQGTRWSSGLPGAHSHWLPVWDHPRNRFSMEVDFRIPVTHQALFTGTRAGESVNEQYKEVRYYTEGERAVPTLRFAIGEFDTFDLTAGRYRIELFAEPEQLEGEQATEWLMQARMQLESMTQRLQNHLSHRTLTFLYLEEDMWELNPWGSGFNLLFAERGNMVSQIQRAIAAQWFGVGRIAERWEDTEAVHLLREWLVMNLEEAPESPYPDIPEMDLQETVYRSYAPSRMGSWGEWLATEEGAVLREKLSGDIDAWFLSLPTLLRWRDFSDWIYEQSGRAMLNPPVQSVSGESDVDEEVRPDTLVVGVPDGDLSETVTLQVRRSGDQVDEAINGRVRVIHLQGEETHEVTFRRAEQEIVVPGARGVENVIVDLDGDIPVELRMEKPVSFWLYQLREGDVDAREEAALGLSDHRDNPDLQLALTDRIESEEDPDVRAAMLRTLGDVTRGASGTDQIFRNRFTLDEQESIQLALVYAMGYYEGNSDVITLLRRIVVSDVPVSVKREAIHSLDKVRGGTSFAELSRALFANEASEPVLTELLTMVARDSTAEAIERAEPFLQPSNPYSIRRSVLDVLLETDDSEEQWLRRLEQWGADLDPRIRYHLIEGVEVLSETDREQWLQDRLIEEDDVRIRYRLQELTGS
ncbi:MAG: hypothetical protein WEA36_06150 [Balneolaceae bacterium]